MCFRADTSVKALPKITRAYKVVKLYVDSKRGIDRRCSPYGNPETSPDYRILHYPVGAQVVAKGRKFRSNLDSGLVAAHAGVYVFLTKQAAREDLHDFSCDSDRYQIIEVAVKPQDFLLRSQVDTIYGEQAATYRKVRVLRVVR